MQGLSQLAELWNRLDQRAKTVVIVAAALCVGGAIALMRFQSAANYSPLYSNLSPEDAGQMVEKLKTAKVPYRLTGAGTCIEVPEDQVYEQRIALAKQGLPASGQVGFEIFDKSSLPGTEFSNRVNYQRALQGELARTISAMAEVRSARVHLVLPEESLFSEKTKASASVVLDPKPGAEIGPELTAAVAHIVASAVQGVKSEDITVVDSGGRVLRGPESGGIGGLSANQFELQREYQDRLCRSLQSMLDSVLGPNQSVVRVQAQLDFDAEETKNESIVPVLSGKGLVSSEKLRQEQYQAGAGGPGGNAGVQPNLGFGATGGGGGRNGSYLNRDETRQYEYSRNTSSVVKAPGKIKTLTVAAIIDETLSADAENKVKQVLTAASGLNAQRGDVVTVQRMKIQAAEAAKTEETQMAAAEKSQRTEGLLHLLLRGGLSVAAGVLILMSVVVAMRQFREASASLPPMDAQHVPGQSHEAVGAAGATAWSQGQSQTYPQPNQSAQSHQPGQPSSQGQPPVAPPHPEPAVPEANWSAREQLRRIANDDTEAVADRIQSLLQNVGN